MKTSSLVFLAATTLLGCKASGGKSGAGDFSGLYTLNVNGGQTLTGDAAVAELSKYCGQGALEAYLAKIASRVSFNAGYAEHPNAGYDASVVKKTGPDGVDAYYFGDGQMYDGGDSLAMFPPTNGNISALVASYCGVTWNSIQPGRSGAGPGCAYPSAEITQGGSVSGSSASGQINGSGCLTAKLSNGQIQTSAEFAFCPDSLGTNFHTTADGAAGEMSLILRGGG